jgi:predicted ester cyclase
MSAEDNKLTVRRFYDEVINQMHLAVLDELQGDSYVSHDLPSDPAALKGFISGFHAAFPDGQITIEQLVAEGDTVAARLTFHGTSRQRARLSRSQPRTCIVWWRARS